MNKISKILMLIVVAMLSTEKLKASEAQALDDDVPIIEIHAPSRFKMGDAGEWVYVTTGMMRIAGNIEDVIIEKISIVGQITEIQGRSASEIHELFNIEDTPDK